jgi:hypothetical protein
MCRYCHHCYATMFVCHCCCCCKSFSYENEDTIHEHLCSLGIPVGMKVVCPHCNAHFASYASLAALQHEHCCAHNPTNGSDNGWTCYITNTPQITNSSVCNVYDTNLPVCDCVVHPMHCFVVVSLSERNLGNKYYCCSKLLLDLCHFFKWAE